MKRKKIVRLRWTELENIMWDSPYDIKFKVDDWIWKNKNQIAIYEKGIYKQVVVGYRGIEFDELHIHPNQTIYEILQNKKTKKRKEQLWVK